MIAGETLLINSNVNSRFLGQKLRIYGHKTGLGSKINNDICCQQNGVGNWQETLRGAGNP